jgi:carboxyl-terminal processing protease
MRLSTAYSFLLFVFLFSCEKKTEVPTVKGDIKSYIDNFLNQIELNALNRKKINFQNLKDKVYQKASTAKTIDDQPVKDAILVALIELGETHSFFVTNKGEILKPNKTNCETKQYTKPVLPANVGYLKVEPFNGNEAQGSIFAEKLQAEIKKQDNSSIKGWIIDLRGTSGEKVPPLIDGLGPILGEGTCGYFIDYEGATQPWAYFKGVSNNIKVDNPYTLINQNNKIAILIDQATSSNGEAAAISFIGKTSAKSIGVKTCGSSTVTQQFPFLDGSVLYLAISLMADRNRKIYGSFITPDIVESDPKIQIEKAINWIVN